MQTIVKRELFADPNAPTAEEEDMMPCFLNAEIGVATMVYEFRAATAHRTVHPTARVQAE